VLWIYQTIRLENQGFARSGSNSFEPTFGLRQLLLSMLATGKKCLGLIVSRRELIYLKNLNYFVLAVSRGVCSTRTVGWNSRARVEHIYSTIRNQERTRGACFAN
jgi:hypothetical protein